MAEIYYTGPSYKLEPGELGGFVYYACSEAVPKVTFNKQIPKKIRHMVPIDRSILLSSFSKEELMDYDLAQDAIKALFKPFSDYSRGSA